MSINLKRGFLAILAIGVGACVTRGDIEEIKKNQEKILEKIDALARSGAGRQQAAQPQRPRGPDPEKVYSVPVDHSPIKGTDDAWVTVAIVSEFQCPYCKRVKPTLDEIGEKYGKDVRFVFKHNPLSFHNRAMAASNAASCAQEQGKFWQMHDAIFADQQQLEDANFEDRARSLGLDLNRFKSCYAANKYKSQIEADQALVTKLGARGTPAFFINGRFLSGAQPFPAFQALIDAELKKAKDSGVAKRDYYVKQVVEKGEKSL